MKKILLCIAACACLLNNSELNAQGTWTKKATFPGANRDQDANFSIGHYGFIGGGFNGSNYYNDFYKWNQTNNTWSPIATYPGAGAVAQISFAINGHGYVGLGEGSGGVTNDLWRYDTGTNSWTAMASFPGSSRYASDVFVIGHKAYLVGGSAGGPPYFNDVWVYDANANTWKQLNNTPMGDVEQVVAFSIGNHGYVCGGYNNPNFLAGCWEYDTTNDSWTSIASLPVPISGEAFVIGSTAYIPEGENSNGTLKDGYAYDTVTKAWTTFTNLGANGIERRWSVAFTVGNYGYIGTGYDSLGNYLNDLWQYYPCSDTLLTSVNQLAPTSKDMKLYPNPNNGSFKIDIIGLVDNQNAEIEITNVLGEVIYSTSVHPANGVIEKNIDLPVTSSGTYFIRVITSDKVYNSKVVISR